MPINIEMPRLSDTMQAGTVVKWNVKEGQKVKSGDTLADIETDKATMELQSFEDGTVASIAVPEGQNVPIGTVILVLTAPGEDVAAAKSGSGAAAAPVKKQAQEGGQPAASANGGPAKGATTTMAPPAAEAPDEGSNGHAPARSEGAGGRIFASPLAKKIAAESNVDLGSLQGSGPVELRAQLNEQLANQGVKLSVNDFVVRACAIAMHQHPYVNTKWAGTPGNEAIEYLPDVNVGVAIALPVMEDGTGGGLVVATIRNADVLGLRQISAETKRLSEKARTKGLSVEEMSDATFTISNLGMFGVEAFTAIINPPNTAILAVGGAVQKAVVKDGQIVPGHVMSMTMSSDHRVIDGAMAANYLNTVKSLLEKPATLLV